MEQQNEQVTVKQVAIKWGLILGILSIVVFLVTYFGGYMGSSWAGWIGPAVMIVLIFFAQKEFKEEGNGYMSYGQGLGLGTLVAGVSGLVSSIFSYIYIKFINPDYLVELLDISRAQMEDQGQGEDQVEVAMEMMEKFMSAEMTAGISLLGAIFIGFIASLILSAITKNNDPSLEV